MKDAKGHGSNPRGTHSAGIASLPRPVKIHPDVVEQIRRNPGGFSIKPRTGQQPTSGYMVAQPGRTHKVSEADLAGPNGPRIISQFANANADVLRKGGAHIGGWTDKETGITHLDVSHNIKNRNSAVTSGRKRNQISIWDVKKGREIKTGGTGD